MLTFGLPQRMQALGVILVARWALMYRSMRPSISARPSVQSMKADDGHPVAASSGQLLCRNDKKPSSSSSLSVRPVPPTSICVGARNVVAVGLARDRGYRPDSIGQRAVGSWEGGILQRGAPVDKPTKGTDVDMHVQDRRNLEIALEGWLLQNCVELQPHKCSRPPLV